MSNRTTNTISGVLSFAAVLLVIVVLAVVSTKPVNIDELDGYRADDNLLGIENAHDYGSYADYLQHVTVTAENSPIGPEFGY